MALNKQALEAAAKALFVSTIPRNLCRSGWDSGAILGADNAHRKMINQGAELAVITYLDALPDKQNTSRKIGTTFENATARELRFPHSGLTVDEAVADLKQHIEKLVADSETAYASWLATADKQDIPTTKDELTKVITDCIDEVASRPAGLQGPYVFENKQDTAPSEYGQLIEELNQYSKWAEDAHDPLIPPRHQIGIDDIDPKTYIDAAKAIQALIAERNRDKDKQANDLWKIAKALGIDASTPYCVDTILDRIRELKEETEVYE